MADWPGSFSMSASHEDMPKDFWIRQCWWIRSGCSTCGWTSCVGSGGAGQLVGARARRGSIAALAHVVVDVGSLAVRVFDVDLRLFQVAVLRGSRSGVNEEARALLICRLHILCFEVRDVEVS